MFFRKKKSEPAPPEEKGSGYIREIRHTARGAWHQYDVLLAVGGYGWETMIDWAEYLRTADLVKLSTIVTTEHIGGRETEHKDEYQKVPGSLGRLPSLAEERASLGIGGISRMLGVPMKVVWFNQTGALRLLTTEGDEELVRAFAEALVCRRFRKKAR